MNISGSIAIQLAIAFIIFMLFFGWIGLRRGAKREGIVLFVSTISWFILKEKGDILTSVVNLGGKLLTIIATGGLSPEGTITADPSGIEPWITEANKGGFRLLSWAVIVVITYWLTNKLVKEKKDDNAGWALLWGVANGLFFGSIFVPLLFALYFPSDTSLQLAQEGRGGIIDFLTTGFRLLKDIIGNLWTKLGGGIQPYVLLLLLTLFLILVYSSIRGAKIANLGGKSKC